MRRTASPNLWLGRDSGYVSDWATQQWVRLAGRRVDVRQVPWLDAPPGPTRRIGTSYLSALCDAEGLTVDAGPAGLLPDFAALAGPRFDPSAVDAEVRRFYERTGEYRLTVGATWARWARPPGRAVMWLFARRLQQLNLPLDDAELRAGLTSEVLRLVDGDGRARHAVWRRRSVDSGRMVYLGLYDITRVPGHDGPCLRTWFPLPNGGAAVLLRPEARPDGSLVLHSDARRFGEAGFYFVVRRSRTLWVRPLASFHERLHVYRDGLGTLRTDHCFELFGRRCIELRYAIHRRGGGGVRV